MKVPIIDLKSAYIEQRDELNRAAIDVLESGYYVSGPNVAKLEQIISEYTGSKYAVGVSSGTDALRLSLQALGVTTGDEVLTPVFTFFACSSMIALNGAKPVFVDMNPDDFNIDTEDLQKRVTSKTKGIVVVHLYGHPARMKQLLAFAKEHDLFLLEDCAQSIGAKYNGKLTGSLGTCGTFSFYPTKNLHACGEGGIVISNDENLTKVVKLLRSHGEEPRYYHHILGTNARMHEIQAAMIIVKMKLLEKWNSRRRQIAQTYNSGFKSLPITLPPADDDLSYPVYHTYTIRTSRRDELKDFLIKREIGNMVYYPIPLHLQPVFKNLGYVKGDFPNAEKASSEVISLPIHPYLENDQVEFVIDSIKEFFSAK
jgi:dTDP-4-amino-4,6-dideoxygalactose transaminase